MNNNKVAQALVKLAGQLMGPGIPDGTGPYGNTDECQMNNTLRRHKRRYLRRGPQDGTGPRGDTSACPLSKKEVRLSKTVNAADVKQVVFSLQSMMEDIETIMEDIKVIHKDPDSTVDYGKIMKAINKADSALSEVEKEL